MGATILPDGSAKYDGGGFSVIVQNDGAILVKPDDSLSKYSMAIHGNFNNLYEYLRKEGSQLKPITNVNLIYAHEILYHQPSLSNGGSPNQPAPAPPILNPPSDLEIEKILREAGFPMTAKPAAKYLLNTGRGVQGGLALLGTFVELGALGFAVAGMGAILSVVASCLALYEARNYDIRLSGKKGTVYGAVGWAFDLSVPFPYAMERSLEVNRSQNEINIYKSTWSQAVSQIGLRMNTFCSSGGYQKSDVQMAFQAWSLSYGQTNSSPVPEWLAAGLLVDVAYRDYSRSTDRFHFLQPWSWFPNDKIEGRPSYPPAIDQKYPYGADMPPFIGMPGM